MDLLMNIATAWAWLLAAGRLVGLAVVAPVLGASAVPVRVRVFAAIAISLAVVARGAGVAPLPGSWLGAAGMLALEVGIGVAIGYALRLVFVGLELAAVHVAQQLGLGLAESYDPFGSQTPGSLRNFYRLCGVVVFLGVGGHRLMLDGVLRSFRVFPSGAAGMAPPTEAVTIAAGLLGVSFSLALKVAAPVLIAMLAVSAAMGILQRTAPQFHVLSIGMPIRTMVGLLVAAAGLVVLGPLLSAAATAMLDAMTPIVGPAGG